MATKFYLTPQEIDSRANSLESQYRQSPYLNRLAKVDLLKKKILQSKLPPRKKRSLYNRLVLRENRLKQNFGSQGGAALPVRKIKVRKKRVQWQEDDRIMPPPPKIPQPPPLLKAQPPAPTQDGIPISDEIKIKAEGLKNQRKLKEALKALKDLQVKITPEKTPKSAILSPLKEGIMTRSKWKDYQSL